MIGVILGSAFDRAISLTLRHWRIVICVWVVLGCAYIFDQTQSQAIVSVLSIAWIPIPAILAGTEFSRAPSIRASSVARFYVVSLLWFATTIGMIATLAAILIPDYLHARETGSTGILSDAGVFASILAGLVVSVWIGTKWSFAPTIALFRSRPIAASFGASWALTREKFWQTLLFNAAAMLAYVAVWLGPVTLASFAIGAVYNTDAARISQVASHYVPAIFIPLLVYGGIAEWVGYVRWLEWLESSRADAPRDAL